MATFGKTTNGTQSSGFTVDTKAVSPAVPTFSGRVRSLTARLFLSSAGSTSVRGVIYADNGSNAPGDLLAVTEEFTVNSTSEAAYTADFSGANQIDITAGTTYWIGVHFADPGGLNLNISRDNTYGYQKNNADTYSDGPSDPFGSAGTANGPIDVYVTHFGPGENLFINESFEVGTGDGWSADEPYPDIETSLVRTGSKALKLQEGLVSQEVPVTPGQEMEISCWAATTDGGNCILAVFDVTYDNWDELVWLRTENVQALTGTYQQYSAQFIVPTGCTLIAAGFAASNSSGRPIIDDVFVGPSTAGTLPLSLNLAPVGRLLVDGATSLPVSLGLSPAGVVVVQGVGAMPLVLMLSPHVLQLLASGRVTLSDSLAASVLVGDALAASALLSDSLAASVTLSDSIG